MHYKNKSKEFMRKEKDTRDRISFKESETSIKNVIKDYFLLVREWVTDYGKIVLPVVLLILVCITVMISLNARAKVDEAAKEAMEVLEETKTDVQEVKETAFEEDAYTDINNLFNSYYEALEMGDIDVLIDIQSAVTETESIRLQKMSEYIDRYENIHVYTKPGPYMDTYIAYVYSEVYLKDRTEYTPGLQAFYVCLDDNGSYYINNGELSEEEAAYIKNISEQSDVVDLKNSVNVAYSKIMEDNADLSEYWANISVDIDLAVGEQLALEAKLTAQLDEENNSASSDNEGESSGTEESEENAEPTVTRVRATEQVNIRKSASASADKLGSASEGDTFVLIEQMANGWSKVSYQSGEAYISSQYLEVIEDASGIETTQTVTVNSSSLNVRSSPDASSSKLGVLTKGQVVDLIETADGWCKIKFDGQIGYVKEEFVD